ncbi:FAD-dependent oxidoreductase [Pseudarcicella hirudinis]|uniref:FAD-dependent oxidoreductase n=1 Tax=Pseudarcicella hirudinis TaxID=1079859 RepID=UPI0035E638DA
MGLATSYQLGKRKASVLVLERFKFLNQQGSSAGFSRQYRIPYPDEYMVNMALEAQPYWDELQTHTPKTLMDKVGTLWFGDPNVHSTEGNIAAAEKAMDAAGVKYTTLTSKEVEDQYHFRNLPSNYTGLFQADGASIDLVATLETLHDLNLKSPSVTLKEFSPVYQINQIDGIFHVTTPEGTHLAKKLVITPGPYINNVLNLLNFKVSVTYWEMASAYFKKKQNLIFNTLPGLYFRKLSEKTEISFTDSRKLPGTTLVTSVWHLILLLNHLQVLISAPLFQTLRNWLIPLNGLKIT